MIIPFLLGATCLNYAVCNVINNKDYEGKCSKYDVQRLSFLHDSTRKFVRWLNRDQPVELVKEVIHNQKSNNKHVMNKVVSYERPFFAISGVLFLFAVVILVSGITISYRLIYGNAMSPAREKASDVRVKCRINLVYMFTIVIISCLLTLTDVGLFLTNNRISDAFPTSRKTLTESIDDLLYVQNKTIEELNRIFRDGFERAVSHSMTEFRALADCGSDIKYSEFLKRNTLQFKKATNAAMLAVQETREVLTLVNQTLRNLQTLSKGLKTELGKMDAYYKEAQRKCLGKGKFKDEDLCQMFVNEKDVLANGMPLEPSSLDYNVSIVMSKLDNFSKALNFTPVLEFVKTRSSIEHRLCKKRATKLKELKKLYSGVQFARDFVLDTVKKYSDELADKTLMPIRRNINTVLATDSWVLTYDAYRWWITFFVALTVLIALLTTMASVTVKGMESYLVSSSFVKIQSTQLQVLVRRLLLSSVVLHVTLAVVVSACSGIVFLFVSNMEVLCEISTDYKHIDDIFGTSDLLKQSSLFTRGHKPIKLFQTISECPKRGTLWQMFKLDKKFNINEYITQKIPRITEGLFRDSVVLNYTLGKGPLQMQNIVEQWKHVGVDLIDVDMLLQHVDNPIVDQSFHKLSATLTSFRGNAGSINEVPFKLFQSMSNQAFLIEEDYIKMFSVLSKLLNQRVKEFKNWRERTTESFGNVRDLYSNVTEQGNVWNKNENVDHNVMNIVKDIRIFLKDGVSQVTNNIGICGAMKDAYGNAVCSLCQDMFESWNTWWILLLVCSCLTILSVVFCILFLKQVSAASHSTPDVDMRENDHEAKD